MNIKENFLRKIHHLNILLIVINFSLNFAGSPFIKYHYLFHVALTLLCVFFYDFDEIIPEVITFLFLEGQGRIVWEYQSWARIIFDITLLVLILRGMIRRRKIIDYTEIPVVITFLIIFHFMWFVIQVFNVNGLSSFAAIASTKMYVFPILLFLNLQHFSISENSVKNVVNISLFLIILEGLLLIYQAQLKETHLLVMSSYYQKAMKGDIFVGKTFRPFGTTNLPGGFSAFFFLTIGLLFLKKLSFKQNFFKFMIILLSLYCMFISHVRSAFVKYILIIFLIQIGHLAFHRFSIRKLFLFFIGGLILIGSANYAVKNFINLEDEEHDIASSRFSNLGNMESIKDSRLTPDEFAMVFFEKLIEHPLGRGPGLTGAVSSLSDLDIAEDPLLDKSKLWAHDSLLISLTIDLGVGLFFYVGLIFYIIYYLLKGLVAKYVEKDEFHFKIILCSIVSIFVIVLGNWGAIGLPYNPESFMFWLYAGLGFGAMKNGEVNV